MYTRKGFDRCVKVGDAQYGRHVCSLLAITWQQVAGYWRSVDNCWTGRLIMNGVISLQMTNINFVPQFRYYNY